MPQVTDVLWPEEVAALAPALTAESQQVLLDAVNAQVRRKVPTIAAGTVTDDVMAEVRWLAFRAVERLATTRGWIKQEGTGPYSVVFGDIPDSIFTAGEESTLASLCPVEPSTRPGRPRGSFPAPAGIERLFTGRW